jgi:hypothetical protein
MAVKKSQSHWYASFDDMKSMRISMHCSSVKMFVLSNVNVNYVLCR